MKGFKATSKSFSFPTSADASFGGAPRTGGAAITPREMNNVKSQLIRPHFRSKAARSVGAPPIKKFALGGGVKNMASSKRSKIGDQGNALVQRKKPVSQVDADAGGKGSVIPGYKKGGSADCKPRFAKGGRIPPGVAEGKGSGKAPPPFFGKKK